MQSMYDIVARELKSVQITDLNPQDYLNFYYLGNRKELLEKTEMNQLNGSEKVSDAANLRDFVICLRAKGMRVDDEYVLIGSANINERSFVGTEIAMGAYQPHHTIFTFDLFDQIRQKWRHLHSYFSFN